MTTITDSGQLPLPLNLSQFIVGQTVFMVDGAQRVACRIQAVEADGTLRVMSWRSGYAYDIRRDETYLLCQAALPAT